MLNNYVFEEGEDEQNAGILIPRYKALGRTAPNGKVYPETYSGRQSEDDLVPVRSIISKFSGDTNIVTPDLIGKKFKDFTSGAAIGLSFATSLTEDITQGALGLKHGGHERVLDPMGYLIAPSNCTFREEGRFIYLKTRAGELKYPRPDNLVTMGKDKFEKGERVCCAYNTSSPIARLNSLISLMKARGSAGIRYYEKDSILVSDCYAYEDGVIKYVESKAGNIEVHIGSKVYLYNPNCMYYLPEGSKVKKHDRICSGIVSMNHVVSELGNNINEIYQIFRKQFYTLQDQGFLSTGITSLSSTQEEIIELLFTGLTKTVYDPEEDTIEEIDYLGSEKSVLGKKSFYNVLSYGYSSRIVSKALKGEVNLSSDTMTETILGLLLTNKLDDKK